MAAHIRDLDPYDHPMATSYERPLEPWCEIVTPHEYMQGNYMDELEIDAHLSRELLRAKSYGKPVLYTEFGNGNLMPNELLSNVVYEDFSERILPSRRLSQAATSRPSSNLTALITFAINS